MKRASLSGSGFTLIEVTVILAVLAILAAAITPMVLQQLVDAKVDATRREARLLNEAMLGRPDAEGSFGFFGDMGRWPVSFEELIRPAPGTPLFTTATFRSVGMGWKGPYLNTGESGADVLIDAFGRPYRGAAAGQVRSAGPDGLFDTADDIVYPPARPNPGGRLMVTVKRMAAGDSSYTLDPAGIHRSPLLLQQRPGGVPGRPRRAVRVRERAPGRARHRRPADEVGPARWPSPRTPSRCSATAPPGSWSSCSGRNGGRMLHSVLRPRPEPAWRFCRL